MKKYRNFSHQTLTLRGRERSHNSHPCIVQLTIATLMERNVTYLLPFQVNAHISTFRSSHEFCFISSLPPNLPSFYSKVKPLGQQEKPSIKQKSTSQKSVSHFFGKAFRVKKAQQKRTFGSCFSASFLCGAHKICGSKPGDTCNQSTSKVILKKSFK